MKTKLTKEFVESIGSSGTYLDTDLTGLQLLVTARSKSYYVRIKSAFTGKAIRVLLGKYPEMTLLEAREAAKKVIAEIKAGGNPNAKKRAEGILDNRDTLLSYLKICLSRLNGKVRVTRADLKKINNREVEVTPIGLVVELVLRPRR